MNCIHDVPEEQKCQRCHDEIGKNQRGYRGDLPVTTPDRDLAEELAGPHAGLCLGTIFEGRCACTQAERVTAIEAALDAAWSAGYQRAKEDREGKHGR